MNVIQALIDLQDVDGLIREQEQREKDIQICKAKANASLSGANAALDIAKSQLEAMNKRIANEKDEKSQLEAKLKSLQDMPGTTSTKEIQQRAIQEETLQHEIETCVHRIEALETDELSALELKLKEAEKKVESERGGMDDEAVIPGPTLAEVRENLVKLRAERAEKATVVKGIDPAFLLYYERLSTKRWPVVVPLVGDGVCDGCHMKQPPFISQLVRHNAQAAAAGQKQQRAACTMCGRLLYDL